MSAYELESAGSVFLGSLEFFWEPTHEEPAILANKIDTLSDAIQEDMLFPLVASRQVLIDDIQDRFFRQVDLEDNPWKEWSKKYGRTKGSGSILQLGGALYQAVTDPEAYPIVGNDIHINTSGFPVYWHIHNVGGVAGMGVTIPKRSFLGLSEQAGFAIIDVFDDWIAGLLDIIIGPATGTAMMRGGRGRIAGRIGLGRQRNIIPPTGFAPESISGSQFGLRKVGRTYE